MGRPETPLDAMDGPLKEFAARLRRLRADSGGRSYQRLAKTANFAAPTLARAASGRCFPSWEVTRAYVLACDGDPGQWRSVWEATERLIRGDDPGLPGPLVRQLPADLPDFVGRTAECDGIRRLVECPPAEGNGAPTVIVVCGPGGIGKTTLAVHVAYQVADRYPDGHLFADLRGHDDQPLAPAQVALRFLAALAIPIDRRADPVASFRSAVAGRRLLIVLDNAAGEEQVSPLLPGAAGSLVVVTSRQALGSLPSTRAVRLDALDQGAAVQLLSRIAGEERAGPFTSTATLARLCGCFPLALRIAGARLASDPAGTADQLADRLRDEEHRLRRLAAGDRDLSAFFGTSYRLLADPQRRVFRSAGLFPGPDFSLAAIAVLADRDALDVETALHRLVDANLVHPAAVPGRYRMHDLLRLYARERCEAEGNRMETSGAIRRLAAWFLRAVDAADRELLPTRGRPAPLPGATALPDRSEQPATAVLAAGPTAWYDAEQANLIAVIRAASRYGHHDIAWRIAVAMRGLLELRGNTADWGLVHQIGLASARAIADRAAEGWVLNGMGSGYWHGEAYAEAIDCYQKALAIRAELGDDRGIAVVLNNLGSVYCAQHRYDEAIECLRSALGIREKLGDALDKSFALNSLGHLEHERGMFADALPHLEEALQIRRDLGNRNGEAATLHCLGDTLTGLGRLPEALACFRQALTIFRQLGNRYGEAVTLHSVGSACQAAGRSGHARRYLRSAISRYRDLGQHEAENAANAELSAAAPPPGG